MTDFCLISTCPCQRFNVGDQVDVRDSDLNPFTLSGVTHDTWITRKGGVPIERGTSVRACVWRNDSRPHMGCGTISIDANIAEISRTSSK